MNRKTLNMKNPTNNIQKLISEKSITSEVHKERKSLLTKRQVARNEESQI